MNYLPSGRAIAVWAVLASTFRAGLVAAADSEAAPAAEAVRFFEKSVRPVLIESCYQCHGEKKQRGGLRVDSRAALMTGGDQGPALVPGKPEDSLLLRALSHATDLKMPPSGKLPAQQIRDLAEWVRLGAPWPGTPEGGTAVVRRGEFQITDRDRAHWSFRPLRAPEVPTVRDAAWAANPIDRFVLRGLEQAGLRPGAPAEKHELVRRLYFGLTGLPPTPAEVQQFLADPSPDAWASLVDRLLASPHHGEKWGRHWLDLVRFAETNSYERDGPKPNAWRYRDYVIRSFNADKPYDRFIREQLAGDELPDGGVDGIIATGFYRLGIWDDEPTDRDQAFYDGLDDIVATTGQVFLGLTLDCARCHDHKLDPLPQKDYYRLLAFFRNIHHYRNGGSTDEVQLTVGPNGEPGFAYLPREKVRPEDLRQGLKPGAGAEYALCVTETGPRAAETFVLLRGHPQLRGDRVEPAFPQILGGVSPTWPEPSADARSSGRRRVLADWIASADNPLTARVIVNRIWQHHFGRGLVRTPNDFGLQGDRPTHPALLDYLASEFIRNGWRLKPLHRLILTSQAYRMSARANPAGLAADPTNNLFWRFDARRLSAEEIRDTILAVNGSLNSRMYGPGIYVDIPREVLAGQSQPGKGWGKSPPVEQNRRSVYIHVKRSLLAPILESFDAPDTDRSAPVRFATTQPGQALGLLNSEFVQQQAGRLAERLRREVGNDTGRQVGLAIELATARPATAAEIRRGIDLVQALRGEHGLDPDAALRYYCLVVLNLNEFMYLD